MQGKLLKRRRLALGMTQTELAHYLGSSIATIHRWESEQKKITKIESAGIDALLSRLRGL